jgi:hypothetical protein
MSVQVPTLAIRGPADAAGRGSLEHRHAINSGAGRPKAQTRTTIVPCGGQFADAGNAGNLSTSRASCWMMTFAFRFDAIFLMRSIDATVCARS